MKDNVTIHPASQGVLLERSTQLPVWVGLVEEGAFPFALHIGVQHDPMFRKPLNGVFSPEETRFDRSMDG